MKDLERARNEGSREGSTPHSSPPRARGRDTAPCRSTSSPPPCTGSPRRSASPGRVDVRLPGKENSKEAGPPDYLDD